MSVITNTTVISNFARINQLEILHILFETLYIPTEVLEEIRAGVSEGYTFLSIVNSIVYPIREDGWIHLTSIANDQELKFLGKLPQKLHPGEASCLTISKIRDWLLLTDDQAARKESFKQGIRISGTLGCLAMAVERHICELDQANRWLEELVKQGYRSIVKDLNLIIKHDL